jgi:hypothetical protein
MCHSMHVTHQISTAAIEHNQFRWPSRTFTGDGTLRAAVWLWFVVAVIGQWMLVVHIASFYGRTVAQGNWAKWDKLLTHGIIHGDTAGNLALAMHLSFAAVITAGGPLQLIPQIRARAPAFHRWNGRVYLLTAVMASLAALYLLWIRNANTGSVVQALGITLDAVLIMFCAAMTLRHALAREFGVHRRWAIRLFLVVSGSWFFRVGLFFWIILNHGPVGFDPKTFQGPFLYFLSFAESLLPLAVFELYLRAQAGAGAAGKFAMAAGLVLMSVATGIGIIGVTAFLVSSGLAL